MDLQKFIKTSQKLEKDVIIQFIRDILQGLNYLHKHNIIHRDLKPANILVSDNNKLIIGDLGSAVFSDNCKESAHITSRWHSFSQFYRYRAPEVILCIPYGKPIDIWALGCIFSELLMLKPLFRGKKCFPFSPTDEVEISLKDDQLNIIQQQIGDLQPNSNTLKYIKQNNLHHLQMLQKSNKKLSDNFQDISIEHLEIIQQMLEFNQDIRLTALDLLNHKLFKNSDYQNYNTNQDLQMNYNIEFQTEIQIRKAIQKLTI